MTRTMPRLRRSLNNVALVGNERRHRSDLELVLALENDPEFRASQMEVPEVVFPGRRLRFRIAPDDVRDADVDIAAVVRVADELSGIFLLLRMSGHVLVVVDVGNVR